jgi:hypothetical protein
VRRLTIHVKPRSSRPGVSERDDGSLVVQVRAPPVDGKANDEVIRLLAEYLGCPRSGLRIKSGAGGRTKLVEIDEMS